MNKPQLDMDDDLPGQYRSALLSYLADQHESTLNRSYEIGRQALSSRMGILDVLNVHHEVIFDLLRENRASEPEKLVELGKCFLAECLSPFEMMRMSNRETTAALRRLNEMLEAQARRIAHDLHDEFAQLLATVYLELAEINRQSTSDSIHTLVEQITSHLDMARDHLRRLSHELRPPALDQLGLLPALEFLVKGYGKRSGLSVTVTGSTEGRLKDEVETALYRIVQEALNNVTRHAKAGHVQVNLWRAKGMIRCTVRDDGVGFSVPTFNAGKASNGLGLMGIQERLRPLYGSMTIDSTPGDGTELSITIPIGG